VNAQLDVESKANGDEKDQFGSQEANKEITFSFFLVFSLFANSRFGTRD